MTASASGSPVAAGLRIGIVVSRFNEPITRAMERAARLTLREAGVADGAISTHFVPGAWELPLGVSWLLRSGEFDGIVALGCVIRGETPHFEYVSLGATRGLEALAREHGIPIGFGLLTTNTGEQARERSGGGRGNKGKEAAIAVLQMCELAADLK